MTIDVQFTIDDQVGYTGDKALLIANCKAAVDAWASILAGSATLKGTIHILSSYPGSSDVLATAGADDYTYLTSDGSLRVWSSDVENAMITGTSTTGSGSDFSINLYTSNLSKIWIDPTPTQRSAADIPSNKIDLVSILTHEFGHVLGINGFRDWTTAAYTGTSASLFDEHVVVKNGAAYFSGDNVTAVYGGDVALAMTDLYHVGSYLNYDDPLNVDLMGPFVNWGELELPSRLDAAILADLGFGTGYDDILRIRYGHTVALAGAGNDTVYTGSGNDTISGGGGSDTAVYSHASTGYRLTATTAAVTVIDRSGVDGTDTLTGVEAVKFNDLVFDASSAQKTAGLGASQIVDLVELYVASFDRAPDAVGLDYWGGRLADGMSLAEIAKSFFVQPETVAAYPSTMVVGDFVLKVYDNVLGRNPLETGDQAGYDYWVRQLSTGSVSRDVFLLAIINGARASTGSATDALTLANKEAVGAHYALTDGLSDLTWAANVMANVTSDAATVTAANHLADGYYTTANATGSGELIVQLVGVAV